MIKVADLIEYAKNAVGGGYCFGSSGEVCTPSRRQQWATWNPSQSSNLLGICAKWDGMKVWDCSGLFRGAWRTLWKYKSGGATTIYNKWCNKKGTIDTMPDIPGVAVFRGNSTTKEHIGLYIGNGEVIDARGSKCGVLRGTLQSYGKWTHWGMLSDVDYSETAPSQDATSGDSATVPQAREVPYKGATTIGKLNVRTGAGTNFKSLFQVPTGLPVTITEEKNGWGKLQLENAWVKLDYIKPTN